MSRRGPDRLDDRAVDPVSYGGTYGGIHAPPTLEDLAPSPIRMRQDTSHVPSQVLPQMPSPRKRRMGHPSPVHGTPSATPSAPASVLAPDDQQPSSMVPPPKKTRTNTPWTPAEEQRLKNMRDAGNSWAEIAKTFPLRTEGSVKKHWYKDMHYAEFAENESQALLNAIKEYETNKWKVIGQKVGKPAKACEQYAKEHFGKT